jgi:hypothetical protein
MANQYRVECVNEATGATSSLVVLADGRYDAREKARKLGFATGAVEQLTAPPAVSPDVLQAALEQSERKRIESQWRIIWWLVALAAAAVIAQLIGSAIPREKYANEPGGSARPFKNVP